MPQPPDPVYALRPKAEVAGESIPMGWDISNLLEADEILQGTPTIVSRPSGLTFTSPAVNSAPFEDDELPTGTIAISKGVVAVVGGGSKRTTYEVEVLCSTSLGYIRGGLCQIVVY